MKGKTKKIIGVVIVIAILLLPIIVDYFKESKGSTMNYQNYIKTLESGEFALIYYGDTEEENFSDISKILDAKKAKHKIEVGAINVNELSAENKESIIKKDYPDRGWLILKNGSVYNVLDVKTTQEELEEQINLYYYNIIPKDKIAYLTAKNAASYKKAIKSKEVIMSVFGRSTCSWCTEFKPVYNEMAATHDLKIYNFDSDVYDEKEYKKIMDMGLIVPKKCTQSGEDEKLSADFPTPLTIFTKGGKVIDCIGGFVPKDTLEKTLKEVGMIK